MQKERELLYIIGPPKSGTSSVLGMLNASPEVFLLFEAFLAGKILGAGFDRTPRRQERIDVFLQQYPDLRPAFEADGFEAYEMLADRFKQFRYVGDKLVRFVDMQHFRSSKVIFCIRHLTTWLCKDKVVKRFYVDDDVVTTAVDYTMFYLNALQAVKNICVVSLQDFILENDAVQRSVEDFLSLDRGSLDTWWKSVGKYGKDDPKSYWRWWDSHASSRLAPAGLDVDVELTDHWFWREILPVFDKYFHDPTSQIVSSEDLDRLSQLRLQRGKVSLHDLYKDFDSRNVLVTNASLTSRLTKKLRQLLP